MIKSLKALCLCVLIAASASTSNAQSITLGGSDILRSYVADTIKALAKKDRVDLKIDMRGTYAALEDLKNGQTDIALIAVPKGSQIPDGYVAFPVAYQTAVVIVNSINPLEDISTKQLYSIFSKNAEPHAETWSQLGIKNQALRNVMAITTGFADNVIVELFKYSAIGGTNIGPWVSVEPNKQVIYNMIKTNNSAIAVIGKATDNNMIKVLAVSNSDADKNNSYAFKPDRDSIFNGDYPMVLPFYMIFKKEDAAKIKRVARIILGNELAQKIDSTDFYSAPENSRKKSIFELDILK